MSSYPLLLGHRGARGEKSIPENTLASFDRALAAGCDGFEFDVRLSGDGQAVICHDSQIRRRGNFQCAKRKNSLFLFCMKFCNAIELPLFWTLSLRFRDWSDITLDLLRAYPPERGYVVSSFLPEVLQSVHGKDHGIPLGLICETPSQLACGQPCRSQYVIPHHSLARKKVISETHRPHGKKVLVWTVNSISDMKRFIGWGVDGIISDYPTRLALARSAIQGTE